MGIISTGPGSPLTNASASGGKFYAYNNISDAVVVQVAPANPSRQKLTFHNPGPNDVFIYPQFVVNTGTNVGLPASNAALGGCFRIFGNGGTLVIEGECTGVFYAFSPTGFGNQPLTVVDSNT